MNNIKEPKDIKDSLPAYIEQANNRATNALATLPQAIQGIDALLENPKFLFKSMPSEVAKAFGPYAASGKSNAVVDEVYGVVSDELSRTISLLRDLERWIVLLVPKVEDGNNFGVEVQGAIYGKMNEYRSKLESKLEAMPDYYKDRSGAMEKISGKVNNEKVTTSTASKDAKDENGEKKNSESNAESIVTKTTETSVAAPSPDAVQHVVMLDGKWHGIFSRDLELIGQVLFGVYHHLSLNWEKVTLPRGVHGSKSYSHMF